MDYARDCVTDYMLACDNCGHVHFVPLAKAEYKACPRGIFTVRIPALDSNGRMKKFVEDIHDLGFEVLDGLVNLAMQGRAKLEGCRSPACSPRQEGRTAIYRGRPYFQGYGNPFFSVQTASVKIGVSPGGRGRREAQPRPAGGREP